MRCLVIAMLVVGPGLASADTGVYLSESVGGGTHRAGLAAYGEGHLRFHLGFSVRRNDRTVSVVGGAMASNPLYIDCYGDECNVDTSRDGDVGFVGLDFKQRFPIAFHRWSRRIGVHFALHAGPRYYWGSAALTGYSGIGAAGGASIEADVGVIGYYLDAGIDIMSMSIPVDRMNGVSPYITFGAKVGWL